MKNKPSKDQNSNVIKDYLILILIAVIGMVITINVFFRIYYVSRQSIINMWSSKTVVLSQDIEHYLEIPKNAVLFASVSVEDLLEKGASNEEIHQYLISETSIYTGVIESNNTGIYGYINGEYLDSSGWTPPKGFDPLERPWYIDAVKADGEVVFVEPYINIQTGTLMMSVSKLLNDKKSVLSMDIYLDTIQEKNEKMLEYKELNMSMVIDTDGTVVAHSDKSQIGADYSADDDPCHKSIYDGLHSDNNSSFSFYIGLDKKIAFSNKINDQWYMVFVFSEKVLFKSVLLVYLHSGLVLIIVFIALLVALKTFKQRHIENKRLQSELSAIADIYLSLSILDLKHLKLNKMWVSEKLTKILAAGNYSLTRVDEIVEAIAAESSRNMLAQFMDFSTVAQRLQRSKSISHDFLDIENHWTRMHFIAGYRDKNGELSHVIWATESIDEDKRRQEELRQKAETDALTQILNRRGGESRIYEAFERGKRGMFLILDADHFKHVNDTYGHDVGDLVIKAIADCLTETLRDTDIVYRLGGDEFAVFVSGATNREIADIVAKRLFNNVDKITIPGVTDWKLSISVGASFCVQGAQNSYDEYFKQADKAMYESKQHEGNYISFYQ
jgi:diguanylate cyclase (GGDEF)-like protein